MTWLLDTNVISAVLKGVPSVADRVRATPPSAIAISPVTVAELRFGVARRRSQALEASLARLLGDLRVVRMPLIWPADSWRIASIWAGPYIWPTH